MSMARIREDGCIRRAKQGSPSHEKPEPLRNRASTSIFRHKRDRRSGQALTQLPPPALIHYGCESPDFEPTAGAASGVGGIEAGAPSAAAGVDGILCETGSE